MSYSPATNSATPLNQVQALKELYDDPSQYLVDTVYAKNPGFALLPKDESPSGMAGKYLPVPIQYGTPQGRSSTFATAQANQTPPQLGSFFVYRVKNYAVATIQNELLEATKDDAAAFCDEAKQVVDGVLRNFSNDIAMSIFSDGSGSRGTYGLASGSISTGVIQLDNPAQVVNFEVGMTLVSYSVSGQTPTQSTSDALGYVIGVNRILGQVTVSATPGGSAGTPTNWSTSFPYLAVQGDVNFVSNGLLTANMLRICGMGAWIPLTAPTSSDSFWGQNRSYDSRLYGISFNGQNESIEEALIDTAVLLDREGGSPDFVFMNMTSFAAFEKALGSKVTYVEVVHDEVEIAFTGIKIATPYGHITVIGDRNVPPQLAYMIQMDTWKLRSLGKAPHILTYGVEGLEGIRVANDDALEMRWGFYGNLICRAPGFNAVIQLSQ